MFIQSDFAKDSRYQNIDPILVVEGGNITYSQSGLTNNMISMASPNLYQTTTEHQFLAESTINIHCICSASDAAEELGFEVAMFAQSMRLVAAEMLQVQNISMPQQSKAQMMGGNDWGGKFDSVVSFGYSFALRRRHKPVDPGELLKIIEFYMTHPLDTPLPGQLDANGNPVVPGQKGGTNTGGQNGNWGGEGGVNDTPGNVADGLDDGWATIELKVSNTEVTGEQN